MHEVGFFGEYEIVRSYDIIIIVVNGYEGEDMFVLKIVFVVLLCIPLLYFGIIMLSKLMDTAIRKNKKK